MNQRTFTWIGLASLISACSDVATPGTDEVGETGGGGEDESFAAGATDSEAEAEPLRLLAAAFSDQHDTLILSFSEAVAPVADVNPADFRISLAFSYDYAYMDEVMQWSFYHEPNDFSGYLYSEAIGMAGIVNGPVAEQVTISLDPVFNMAICAKVEEFLATPPPHTLIEGKLLVHYSPGATPLTSAAGGELAAIGPEWVLDGASYLYVEDGGWPNLDPQVEIPCK